MLKSFFIFPLTALLFLGLLWVCFMMSREGEMYTCCIFRKHCADSFKHPDCDLITEDCSISSDNSGSSA